MTDELLEQDQAPMPTAPDVVDSSTGTAIQLTDPDQNVHLMPTFATDEETMSILPFVKGKDDDDKRQRAAVIVLGESKKLEELVGETIEISELVFEQRSKFNKSTGEIETFIGTFIVEPSGRVIRTSSPHVVNQLERIGKFAGGPPPWSPVCKVKVTQVSVTLPTGKAGRTFRLNPIAMGKPAK